ncbi:MAG TPA: leucine-rich repeat domain-containing protein [Verrucomicrobiae bacterium]
MTIPNGVASIGLEAFYDCINLTSIIIPNTITNIGDWAFWSCTSLTNITIPKSVISIGNFAFLYCVNMTGIYFQGNAPNVGGDVFDSDNNVTVYYLPGTMGWENFQNEYPDVSVELWFLPNPLILNFEPTFGLHSNQFGFTISWATNIAVAVEASTNLVNWQPVQTNTLTTGSAYFSDSQWTNYSSRFYRLRSP